MLLATISDLKTISRTLTSICSFVSVNDFSFHVLRSCLISGFMFKNTQKNDCVCSSVGLNVKKVKDWKCVGSERCSSSSCSRTHKKFMGSCSSSSPDHLHRVHLHHVQERFLIVLENPEMQPLKSKVSVHWVWVREIKTDEEFQVLGLNTFGIVFWVRASRN